MHAVCGAKLLISRTPSNHRVNLKKSRAIGLYMGKLLIKNSAVLDTPHPIIEKSGRFHGETIKLRNSAKNT